MWTRRAGSAAYARRAVSRDCSFGVTRKKEGCSRVTCWRNFTRSAYTVTPPRSRPSRPAHVPSHARPPLLIQKFYCSSPLRRARVPARRGTRAGSKRSPAGVPGCAGDTDRGSLSAAVRLSGWSRCCAAAALFPSRVSVGAEGAARVAANAAAAPGGVGRPRWSDPSGPWPEPQSRGRVGAERRCAAASLQGTRHGLAAAGSRRHPRAEL